MTGITITLTLIFFVILVKQIRKDREEYFKQFKK